MNTIQMLDAMFVGKKVGLDPFNTQNYLTVVDNELRQTIAGVTSHYSWDVFFLFVRNGFIIP